MTGMFSNSSSPTNSQMIQSGMGSNFRKKLLKDAQTGTYNSNINQTFRSITTQNITQMKKEAEDIEIGGQYDDNILEDSQFVRKRTYATPKHSRPKRDDTTRLVMGATAQQNKRAQIVNRSSRNEPAPDLIQTLDHAAQRNMYGKYPEPVKPEPKVISFAQHRKSAPIVR